jgi:hypothetical protein
MVRSMAWTTAQSGSAIRICGHAQPIKNLYLTGQDIVTCGIGGALMSGLLTAAAVSGKIFIAENIVKEVDKKRAEESKSLNWQNPPDHET